LREEIMSLASKYGRYSYRRITAMLRNDGWSVDHKRVERIWRLEGLKVPTKQPREVVYGSTMAPLCGDGLSSPNKSRVMTS
jgi:transposase InsO family protein